MSFRVMKDAAIYGLVGAVAVLVAPGVGRAATTFNVNAGWDLFQTDPTGTTFPGLGNLTGVSLGTFNFSGTQNGNNPLGRNIGVQNVGATDTIVERTAAAIPLPPLVAGASATIPLTMVALQLQTVTPMNFMGLGLDNYFITLDPSLNSTGSMTITWNGDGLSGSFSSVINVNFDIHKGSLAGTVVNPGGTILPLTSTGTLWSDLPPPGAIQLTNVNTFLSGTSGDRTQDFWINNGAIVNPGPNPVIEQHPNGAVHRAFETGSGPFIPEPASIVMLGIGTLGVGAAAWRSRKRAA